MRQLLNVARFTTNATADELPIAIAALREAGDALENLLDDVMANHGLFPPFSQPNVVILDPVWRERHRRNLEAQKAAAADDLPSGWTE